MRKSFLLLLSLILVAPALPGADLPFGKEKIRDYVLGRLSEMAARKIEVEGDIEVDLGWNASIRLEKVRVANADWAEAPHLLEIDALVVELDMHRLLRGEVLLRRLELTHPTLYLERSQSGQPNWVLGGKSQEQTIVESAAAPKGKPGNLPHIGLLRIDQGELAYRDHGAANSHWVRGQLEQAGGRLNGDGVDVAASGRLGGDLFTLVLRTASLDDLRAGEKPNPVFLLATSGGSRLMVQGTAAAPFALHGLDLALKAHGAGFDQLPLLTGMPPSPPFDLSARLVREAGPWRLEDLDADIGRSDMTGTLTLSLAEQRPRLTADLKARTLAIGQLLAIAPEGGTGPEPAQAPDSQGIDLSALNALSADLDFTADTLLFHQLRLGDVRARLTLQDGVLTLAPLSAAAGGGEVRTRLRLQSRPLQGSARFELDGVSLEQALSKLELGNHRLAGTLNGRVAVKLPPPTHERPAGAAIEPARVLGRLEVEQGRLHYEEPDQRTRIDLTLSAPPEADGPRLRIEGELRGAPLDARLSADPLPALLGDAPYALDGRLRLGQTKGKVQATLLSPPGLEDLKLDVHLSGDFEQLATLTGAPIPALPPVQADGILRRKGSEWTGRGLDIQLGDSDVTGRISVDTSKARPTIEADLQSDQVDVPALMSKIEPPKTRAGSPLKVPKVLTEVDARLDYRADKILTPGPTLEDLRLDTRLEDGRLRLGPVHLRYLDPDQQTRLGIALTAADGQGAKGLTGTLDGRVRGAPVQADLKTDASIDLTEQGPPGTWRVRLESRETKVKLSGSLRDLLAPEHLDLKASASGPSPARLSDLAQVQLPDLPPYRVSTSLKRDGGRIRLEDLSGRVGKSDVSGRIAVDFDNVPTAINLDLTSDRLDYDDLTSLIPKRLEPPESKPKRLFSSKRLGVVKLTDKLQGQVRYRARHVIAKQIPLDDLRLDAKLKERRFSLAPLTVGVGGGSVRLDLKLSTAVRPMKADLHGEVKRVNLRQLLAPFDIAKPSFGTVAGQIKLWMTGDSLNALAASADGGIFLLMTGGALDGLLVQLAGLDAGQALLDLVNDREVPINCGYLNLHSRHGQMKIATLAVDTTDTLFLGGGNIDLNRDWLHLVLQARPKNQSLPTFRAPLRLEGPLRDPKLKILSPKLAARAALAVGLAAIQPLAGLIPLIEPGTESGESPYCTGLMQTLKEATR